ncbi:MAG TPA: 3-deoxy-7-phosphoheptulonate synthase [Bdellovibrionota bacterium]|nr:3-deoxy-7-phosphoheptulonate synthase [Bdellovibrionota bacterium]
MITAAFQGIEGCHSSLVLQSYFKKVGSELKSDGLSTFRQVAMAVISGKADVGLLPVDNAIAGTIREGYDLLAQYDLVPISEVEWKMDHRLLAPEGAELGKLREVLAHPLVLEECGRFLGTLIGARVIPVEDTGLAAREVARSKDPTRAAIAPPEAAAIYGLHELAGSIADHPGNYTRFILFRAQNARDEVKKLGGTRPAEQRKTSLLLSTSHESGSLARCLSILTDAGINLSKLESRPKLGKAWEYLFYVDFEGDAGTPRVSAALERLRAHAQYVQVIGSYDRHRADDDAHTLSAPAETPKGELAHEGHTPVAPMGWTAELLPSSAKGWPKAARSAKPQGSRFQIGPVTVGGDGFVVIAGPCSVESKEQVMATAHAVREGGAVMLRGGVFKPRTNPYAFQGMGWEGLTLLAEAGRATGMPIVSEVMSLDQVERMARECDVLQIGARNMQNFDLLKAVGKTDRTILLKRGMSASIDELLAAAEYILAEGNPHVMLCERGIRTFETATRNTLDLSAVPVLKERTHLPIIVDPSHGVGVRRWIRPLCRAAKAVGAHGIIIEVHPDPEQAKSDKEQALTFEDFKAIMGDLAKIPHASGLLA